MAAHAEKLGIVSVPDPSDRIFLCFLLHADVRSADCFWFFYAESQHFRQSMDRIEAFSSDFPTSEFRTNRLEYTGD